MKILKEHFAFIALIIILGVYLSVKAIPENSWDGWRVGSAQTMLSIKQWSNDGFFKNYLLFLPRGYSKTVRYLDDAKLRQHAQGITTGELIGKRLYYTHYPAGYLIPSALFMKLGAESRFWFRFLAIIFSFAGLIFLYWLFILISKSRLISFLGTFFYGISTVFLDYADSLAAMPIEEFFRPLIMVISLLAARKPEKKYLTYLTWIFYFVFATFSYDSTFFIFAWLIGLDLLIARRIAWKKWLFWALAPAAAFGIQIIQNVLYLGWRDALFDWVGAFKVQIIGSRNNFFSTHLQRWLDPLGWFFNIKWYLGALISVLGIIAIKFIKKYFPEEIDEKFLYLVFFAALFHFLFFPSLFFHQSRAVSIFGGLLIGSLTAIPLKMLIKKRLKTDKKIVSIFIFIAISGLWLIQAQRTYAYIKNWPNNVWLQEKIDFDKKIKNLVTGDKVIFQMLGADRNIEGPDRYPMAPSEDEYYIDAPILGFTNTTDLLRDLKYLKNRSEFPFKAIIIADTKETIKKIQNELKTKDQIIHADNKFIMVFQ